jgi:mannosyltransferase OCH1-like enzyme
MSNIPKNIILTWKNKNIPDTVFEKWRNLNKHYTVTFFTDEDIIAFLKKEYSEKFSNFFVRIPFGKYKADFFRLCYLYKYGGCYVDIDIEPILPIDDILSIHKDITFLSILSLMKGHIFQAVLFAVPKNPIILKCILSMIHYGCNIGIDPVDAPPYTGHPTKCTYENISEFTNIEELKEGVIVHNSETILLGIEKYVDTREGIFFKDIMFGYSRYTNYNQQHGFV